MEKQYDAADAIRGLEASHVEVDSPEAKMVEEIYKGIAAKLEGDVDKVIAKSDINRIVNAIINQRNTDSNYLEGISRVLKTALYAKIRLGKDRINMEIQGDSISMWFPDGIGPENGALYGCIARNDANLMKTWDCPMTYDVSMDGDKTVVKFKFK